MRLYQNLFGSEQEEIISDSYNFIDMDAKYKGVAVQVQSQYLIKGEDKFDIGCGNAFGGTNEEEGEEGAGGAGGEAVEKVIDVIDTFHYQEFGFDKVGYGKYIKEYMKKVLDYLK